MARAKSGNPVAKSKFAKTDKTALSTMITILKDGHSHTYDELAEACGFSRRVVAEWVVAFRRKGLVRIAAWQPDSRRLAGCAEFAWDDTMSQRDCNKPKLTRREMKSRYYIKLKNRALMHTLAGQPMEFHA